ncbi:MAG: AhpC/TSA family protein [Alphaproteobacteria bacterium]|nr:AhpC/TSA family protein [Alphaproteobacteria bacterium]
MNLKQTLQALYEEHTSHLEPFFRDAYDSDVERVRMLRVAEDGLGVGDYLPDFELQGADGKLWRSGELLDRGPLVLAFFRGGWCPYCDLTISALDRARPAIEALGASAVGVMPETIERVREAARLRQLSFPLLSDPRNEFAGLCGLTYELSPDHVAAHLKRGRDLPQMHGDTKWRLPVPAVFVVEPSARVVFAFSDAEPSRWPDPEELIASLNALSEAA